MTVNQQEVRDKYLSNEDTIKSFDDLQQINISYTIRYVDDDGYQQKTVICKDQSQWDYIPEDNLYHLRVKNLFLIS